jgi:hypothetical protein
MPRARPDYIPVRDGELEHVARNGRQSANGYSLEHRREFFQGLLYLTLARGHKPGAAARYRDKFNVFPPWDWRALEPLPPSAEVAAWDRHCRIRYAKSKEHRP